MQRLLPLLFVFLAVAAGALQPAAPQGFGRHVVTVEAEEAGKHGRTVVAASREALSPAFVLDDPSDLAPPPAQLRLRDAEPSDSSDAIFRRFALQSRSVSYWPNAPPRDV